MFVVTHARTHIHRTRMHTHIKQQVLKIWLCLFPLAQKQIMTFLLNYFSTPVSKPADYLLFCESVLRNVHSFKMHNIHVCMHTYKAPASTFCKKKNSAVSTNKACFFKTRETKQETAVGIKDVVMGRWVHVMAVRERSVPWGIGSKEPQCSSVWSKCANEQHVLEVSGINMPSSTASPR